MELRSRTRLNRKGPASTPTSTPVATSKVSRHNKRALLGRSATEPPVQQVRKNQENTNIDINTDIKKEVSASTTSGFPAVLATIPEVPVLRAQSTPAISSPEDQAFEILERLFQSTLSTEEFAVYKTLISELVRWVGKDSLRRVKNSQALQRFLVDHPGALHIHNKFARSYNKTKIDSFHVPEFGNVARAHWKETDATIKTESNGEQVEPRELSHLTIVKPVLGHKMGTRKAETSGEGSNVHPGGNDGSGDEQDVPDILHVQPASASNTNVAQDRRGDEQTPFQREEACSWPSVASSTYDHQDARETKQILQSNSALVATAVSRTSEQIGEDVVSGGEGGPPPSAASYLAWLHHRQVRFPTAMPNSSECVLLAKKMGRSSASVYEDALYHWGLETDSRRGNCCKQNRLHLLGKDPVFESEHMGTWGAWLRQGKDEMEGTATAVS